jgi:hypothetical protein
MNGQYLREEKVIFISIWVLKKITSVLSNDANKNKYTISSARLGKISLLKINKNHYCWEFKETNHYFTLMKRERDLDGSGGVLKDWVF